MPQGNLKNIFGIDNTYWSTVIIPIVIPVISFFLALLFSLIRDKIKLRKELIRKQNYLFLWIDLIGNQILKQSKLIREFSASLKDFSQESKGFNNVNIHIEKLELIDSISLVSLFSTNKTGRSEEKNKLLFDFENYVQLIKSSNKRVFENLNSYKELTKEITEDWNKEFKKFPELYKKLVAQNHNVLNSNLFIKKIIEYHSDWEKSGLKGMKGVMDYLADKIGPVCRNEINAHPNNELAHEILNCLIYLKFIYDRKNNTVEVFTSTFEITSEDILNGYKKLVEVKEKLAKLKFKPTLYLK